MIKKFVICLIKIYKKIPGPWHGSCIFHPTCSTYAIEAIERFGVLKGGKLAIARIARCNPFNKPRFDPVPYEKEQDI